GAALGKLLGRRVGERLGQAVQVVEQITERVVGARRRRGKLVVADVGDELGRPPGGGLQIDHREAPSGQPKLTDPIHPAPTGFLTPRAESGLLVPRTIRVVAAGKHPLGYRGRTVSTRTM